MAPKLFQMYCGIVGPILNIKSVLNPTRVYSTEFIGQAQKPF